MLDTASSALPLRDEQRTLRHGLELHYCAGPNGRGVHAHPFAQVVVGMANINLASGPNASKTTVSIYPPWVAHETQGNEQVIFDISSESLLHAAEDLGIRGKVELNPLHGGSDAAIEQLARLTQDELCVFNRANSFYLESISHVLIAHVIRSYSSSASSSERHRGFSDPEIAKITIAIDARLETGFTISELAKEVGCPPHVFVDRLRIATGMTPWRFIQGRRIATAKRLLRRESLTLAEIAGLLGFTDQSHFSNVFRKSTGSTPGMYRKS
jgi:AraC-like DNA-binding protein